MTVTQVNNYVKALLDGDKNLKSVFISGEISNFRGRYSSGHMYFSLKDEKAAISCVMFSGNASRLRFEPESGMKVIVSGSITVYPASGQYQINVVSMQPDGKGAIALAYEQLKNKLAAQGVFDDRHKQPLPLLPRRIGVVTSPSGAVIEDIKKVTARRCPLTEIILYPSAVQGDGAATQLTSGIKYFNEHKNVDVIIIGRGGGSMEDLFCFNDENLIWAIYDCTIPIISAVGHETDFTLCDFAADKRAATPSMAAELAVPSKEEMRAELASISELLRSSVSDLISVSYQDVDRLKDFVSAHSPEKYVENELLSIKLFASSIQSSAENRLALEQAQTDALASHINALSPIKLLQKGYSMTMKKTLTGEKCVTSVSALKKGDKVKVRFLDGAADCTVENATKTEV